MRVRAIRRRGGRAVVGLLVGLLVGGGLAFGYHWFKARAAAKINDPALETADELDLVPTDALFFAHARLADLWQTEALADLRKIVERAGPDNRLALDEGFVPAPSTIRRVTIVGVKDEAPRPTGTPVASALDRTQVVTIVALSAPVDPEKFCKANLPDALKRAVKGKEYWLDVKSGDAVHFPTDRVIVYGPLMAVRGLLLKADKTDGPLAPALKLAAGGTRHVVAAVNTTHFPLTDEQKKKFADDARAVFEADAVSFGMVVARGARVEVRAAYKTDAAAAEAEAALKKAADAGRKELWEVQTQLGQLVKGRPGHPKPRPLSELPEACFGMYALGLLNVIEEWLSDPKIARDGGTLTASATVQSLDGSAASLIGLIYQMGDPAAATGRRTGEWKVVGAAKSK